MKTIILELPIDKFTTKAVDNIKKMTFNSMESFEKYLRPEKILWYDINEFIEGVNTDQIDTENNWFAPVTIVN